MSGIRNTTIIQGGKGLTLIRKRVIQRCVVGIGIGLGDLDGNHDDDDENDDDDGDHDGPCSLAPVLGLPPRLVCSCCELHVSLLRGFVLV